MTLRTAQKSVFHSALSLCFPGVIVQFSTNNGVQWQFLRELDFSSFLEPQVVTIELPPPAKSAYTVFRWWQPQQGWCTIRVNNTTKKTQGNTIILLYHDVFFPVGKHSAQWALDDVLIGMNDSSRTGFHDKLDGMTPLRHNWYRIQGGEVTVDCLSLDTALTFNSEAIDSESHKCIMFIGSLTGLAPSLNWFRPVNNPQQSL